MKRTIRGFRYDTEKAERLGTRKTTGVRSWLRESLYRTPRGHYFLAGEGGPDSAYAGQGSYGRVDGSALRPMSDEAAEAWLKKYSK